MGEENKNEKHVIQTILWMVITALLVFIVTSFYYQNVALGGENINYYSSGDSFKDGKEFEKLKRVYNILQKDYLYDIDVKQIEEGAIIGMLEALDEPYTNYFNESEAESFLLSTTEGEYDGVGIYLSIETNRKLPIVLATIKNSPAAESDILPGDYIIEADGKDVTEVSIEEVAALIKGPKNSTVKIKFRRYDSEDNKLNIKKVIAVAIAILVIIMFVIELTKIINTENTTEEKNVSLKYYTVYESEKWGVINAKGETIIKPSYNEMIVIPNPEKDVFIITKDVDYTENTYKSIAVNSRNEQIFTEYDKVEAIQNQDKQNSIWYATNCLKVEKDGLYGLIDFTGKVLLNCQYDNIEAIPYIKNSLVTTKDSKKGLISCTGTIIINNEYEDILALTDQYEDGYIIKNSEEKFGVIGTNKKLAVPAEYELIKNMKSEDNYIVKQDGIFKIYNSSTETTTDIQADDILDINTEYLIVKKADKYGLYDLLGVEQLEAKFEELTYLFSNYYIAKLDDKYGIIDSDGTIEIDFDYTKLVFRKDADFIEGEKNGVIDSDLIDRNFEVKLSGIISEVNVSKGYIKIRVGSEYKYYNFKFEEKTNRDILTDNTLFLDKKDGKYGYINKDGVVIVNYTYDDAKEQNASGYVAVKKDGKWGALDETGKVIVKPELTLDNNSIIDFIGEWHLAEDINAGYYTK